MVDTMRTVVTIFALVAVLTQAVLGSALPGAVLCIKQGSKACSPAPRGAVVHCCCSGAEVNDLSLHVQLCAPCHDECDDCIEVPLPQETLRAGIEIGCHDDLAFLAMARLLLCSPGDVCVEPAPMLQATGPPDVIGCAHADVVASTILRL
jgi:hypothetical protein